MILSHMNGLDMLLVQFNTLLNRYPEMDLEDCPWNAKDLGVFFMSWLPKNYSPKNNQNNCNTIFHRHNKIWPEFLLSLNHPTKSATHHTIQTIYNPSIRQLLEDLNCLFQNLMAFNFKKKFDGFDSDGWIKKAEKYFELIGVPNEERVKVAVMYIKGRAGFWWRY